MLRKKPACFSKRKRKGITNGRLRAPVFQYYVAYSSSCPHHAHFHTHTVLPYILLPQQNNPFFRGNTSHLRYGPRITIVSLSRDFRCCLAGIRKDHRHNITQTPNRRETPQLPLCRAHYSSYSGPSTRTRRFSWEQ